jgi:hypothetical protein
MQGNGKGEKFGVRSWESGVRRGVFFETHREIG